MDGKMARQMDGQNDGRIERQMDKRVDGWMDKWMCIPELGPKAVTDTLLVQPVATEV